MNYFFKFLIPQLMEYFDNDETKLLEIIPQIVLNKYQDEINVINSKIAENQ